MEFLKSREFSSLDEFISFLDSIPLGEHETNKSFYFNVKLSSSAEMEILGGGISVRVIQERKTKIVEIFYDRDEWTNYKFILPL